MAKPTLLGSPSKSGNIGHNGSFAFDSRADIPPEVPALYFFKCGIQDCLDDVLKMPSQERGVYLTALLVMYKEMEGLPADDKMAAMSLRLDVREYRNIKEKLIARGVLFLKPSGRVSNKRFEAEISAYVIEFKNRQEAAKERERRKRLDAATKQGSASAKPQLGDSYGLAKPQLGDSCAADEPQLGGDFSEKSNENNGADSTRRAQRDHKPSRETGQLEVRSYESLEVKSSTINQSIKTRGRDAPTDEEGSIDPKVATTIGLLAVMFGSETDPNHDRAYAVAMKWAKAYSPQDTLDGVMDLDARRRDRSEFRQVSEHLIGQYVRQAEKNRLGHPVPSVATADKPNRQAIQIGPVADGIEIGPGHQLLLSNGARAEWLEKFNGVERDLQLALDEVPGLLNPGPVPIEAQIRRHLSRICKEGLPRSSKQSKPYVVEGVEKIETEQERIKRYLEQGLK